MSQVFPLPEHRHPHDDGSSDALGAFVRLESTGGTGVDRITWHSTSGGAGWEVTTPTSAPAVPVEGYYDLRGEVITTYSGDLTIWFEVDGSRVWPQDADFDTITTDGTIAFDLAAGVMAVNQTMTIRFDPAIDVTSAQAIAQFVHTRTRIFVSTTVSGDFDDNVHAIDDSGSQMWTFTSHTNSVKGVAISDGFSFSTGWDATIAKINLSDGTLVWHRSIDSDVNAIQIASDGSIYVCGGSDGLVWKYDSDVNLIWSTSARGYGAIDIALDSSINVYVGYSDGGVQKIDVDGNVIWTVVHEPVNANSGYIYSIDAFDDGSSIWVANSNALMRLDSSGGLVWEVETHGGISVLAVSVDRDGYAHTGGGWDDFTVRKTDPDGNEVWVFSGHTGEVHDVEVAKDGTVHSGSWDNSVKKVTSAGVQMWSYDQIGDITQQGIAVIAQ